MEGVAALAVLEAVDGLADAAALEDADLALDMGQRAVVRRDDDVSAGSKDGHGLPVAAHSRVDYADEDRSRGPVGHRLDEAVARLPDVELWNLVGKVLEAQRMAHFISDAVHGADRAVGRTEIRHENDSAPLRPGGALLQIFKL